MLLNDNKKSLLTVFVIASFVSACGGGSSGNSAPNTPPASSAPPSDPSPEPSPADTLLFADATGQSGIDYIHGYLAPTRTDPEGFAGGVAAGDYDRDGDIDLFVVRGDVGPNLLYRNEGDNTFSQVSEPAGLAYTKSSNENYRLSGPTFGDLDGDGDLDLFIGGLEGDPSFLFENNGDGTFSDVTAGSGVDTINKQYTVSAAFGDYDLDGDLDMALAHWGEPYASTSNPGDTQHLWRNDSDANAIKFTSVSVAAGIASTVLSEADSGAVLQGLHDYSFTPSFVDINQDRYPDLLLVSDFGTTVFYENNTDGSFINVTQQSEIDVYSGMGSSVADYDNDGDLDWFVTAIFDSGSRSDDEGNALYANDGTGRFTDVTQTAGVVDGSWGWASCFADFDNNGWLDIYHTNGWDNSVITGTLFDNDPSRLFMATGDGDFVDRALASGIVDRQEGRAVVCDDFDNDGDIDVFVIHRSLNNSASLYRNDSTNDNHYLNVRLSGNSPNTGAIGSTIRITTAGETQTRYVAIGNNFTSHNSTVQYFGLGETAMVDTLEVTWPNGDVMTMRDVSADQLLAISQ